MKLFEFFGSINPNPENGESSPISNNKDNEQELANEVFWYILDNDELHKKYFFGLARQIKAEKEKARSWKNWLPIVNAGCLRYYKEQKLDQDPKELFTKEFRRDMAKRLLDHYYEDILKDSYTLGQ